MGNDLKLVQDYIGTIEKELVAGNATEHTHHPNHSSEISAIGIKLNLPTEARRGAKTPPQPILL